MQYSHKGIDDALVAGIQINIIEGNHIDMLLSGEPIQKVSNEQTEEESQPDTGAMLVESSTIEESSENKLPTFPTEVFPFRCRNLIESLAKSLNCDPGYLGTSVLCVAASAIGTTRKIQLKNTWHEYASLFGMIIGAPGTLKSPAIDKIMKPVIKEQNRLYKIYQMERELYQNALKLNKQRNKKNQSDTSDDFSPIPNEPALKHLHTSDTTIEALSQILDTTPRGIIVYRDEIAGWFKSMNSYRKGGDEEFYLSIYSNKDIKVDRKNLMVPLILSNPFVCVIGSIQPEVFHQLKRNDADNGFSDRFLYCFPENQTFSGYNDEDIDISILKTWEDTIQKLYSLNFEENDEGNHQPIKVILDDKAHQAFRNYIDSLAIQINTHKLPDYVKGFAEKLKGMVARKALIIHYLRWAENPGAFDNEFQADLQDIQAACKLADYYLKHFIKVKELMHHDIEDIRLRKIHDWMKNKNQPSFTVRDLQQSNVAGIKQSEEALNLLNQMEVRGFGKWESVENKAKKVFVPNF